ncbi:MAG: flagellar basal body L-ring protein FlgH [Deltaproteobacteria bacterium]|nr:flagellar basal body L-ring protein FlgH [Deltaproteobacteria bacterium]MBW2448877.1 flagellar basal body L-ring protein FlgH [Deltaproteobacteria bacterium]
MADRRYLLLCIALIFLIGCASLSNKPVQMNETVKIQKPKFNAYEPPRPEEGSLWTEMSEVSLFQDMKARKVGDTVTVRIVEDPEAELNANTKTSRSSGVEASKLKFLGYMKALAEKNPRLAQNPGTDDLILASLGLKHDGKGSTDRDGHVKAYISAVVEKVLFNGNLYIRGQREIRVNNETQYITLSGVVRPKDITSSNEVSSTYVADARITYSGTGPVADKQRVGWLGRALDYVWPF